MLSKNTPRQVLQNCFRLEIACDLRAQVGNAVGILDRQLGGFEQSVHICIVLRAHT